MNCVGILARNFATAIVGLAMLAPLTSGLAVAAAVSPLKVSVESADVAPKFVVEVGGGANISPPAPIGGGGGVPLISFSNNGPAFMAGEVSSPTKGAKLLRITFTVTNTANKPVSFRIGDIGAKVGSDKWNDFMAVGYGTQLCAMGDADRKKVKRIVVTVDANDTKQMSIVFPLSQSNSKSGQLLVGNAVAKTFQITGT